MKRVAPILLLACAAATVAACDERLEGGLACGVLCPERPSQLQQDTIVGVALDTALVGFPPLGIEGALVIAARGDTFDTRAILRFDSLPTVWRRPNEVADSAITDVDSAFLVLHFAAMDTLAPPFTLEAYDVDTLEGDDTTATTLLPLFHPSRLLGTASFDPKTLHDTIRMRIPLDSARVREKILGEGGSSRLRVGVRMVAPDGAELRVFSSNGGSPPRLVFRPSLDTAVTDLSTPVFSRTPATPPTLAAELADFTLLATPTPAVPAGVLRLGGFPGVRGYMRFDIPRAVVDSSTIVRAQLLLTQRPNPTAAAATDSGVVEVRPVSAGGAITDVRRALNFLAPPIDSSRTTPASGGVRNFEIIAVVRAWRGTDPQRTPRAIALRTDSEGAGGWTVDFFSNEAPADARPRLVITYVPQPAPRVP